MLGVSTKTKTKKINSVALPVGMSGFEFFVFNDKLRIRHSFRVESSFMENTSSSESFGDDFSESVLRQARESRKPTTVASVQGAGFRKYLYVLPYEQKREKWHTACVQIDLCPPASNLVFDPCVRALIEGRVCLMMVDSHNTILSTSPHVLGSVGYTPENLVGNNLSNLFTETEMQMILSCSADTFESMKSCIFHCLDGSRRDVEIKKFSVPDQLTLYAIFDVSPHRVNEELGEVTMRERRRIGQDLHDSIGQLMTGISLLSRSLANSLNREGHSSGADAVQISELADDASNQIRQISRGLMPTEIVQRGLYESLRELARITTESCGVECVAQVDESVSFGDGGIETHLYRIAQEAVTNAVRHANADRIQIIVSRENENPQLVISDNGTWKVPSEDLEGIGLKTMAYRAAVIDGHLTVGEDAEAGTKVVCRLEDDEDFEVRA